MTTQEGARENEWKQKAQNYAMTARKNQKHRMKTKGISRNENKKEPGPKNGIRRIRKGHRSGKVEASHFHTV